MILKLKTPARSEDSWMFIDGANDLVSAKIDNITSLAMRTPTSDDPTNYVNLVDIESLNLPSYGYRITFLSDGCYYEVLTNLEAYLLNDSGKTIERIN